MTYSPLEGMTILDFSHRLPGPLSTLQLSRLGARVIKIEDKTFGDPFDGGSFDAMDTSFSDWYETLNAGKEILKLDLQNEKEQIKELIKVASIVLMGLPQKIQTKYSLTFEDCQELSEHGVFLEMTSSRQRAYGMHDLNALAQNNLLDLHISKYAHDKAQGWIAPPFLPVAGVTFASHLATESLAAYIQSKKMNTWIKRTAALEEAVHSLLVPLYSEKLRKTEEKVFLHNGRYPCYAIYPLSDRGHLAVASVEAKYWERFCTAFNLDLSTEERFHTETEVFEKVARLIKKVNYKKALDICKELDACVTLIS